MSESVRAIADPHGSKPSQHKANGFLLTWPQLEPYANGAAEIVFPRLGQRRPDARPNLAALVAALGNFTLGNIGIAGKISRGQSAPDLNVRITDYPDRISDVLDRFGSHHQTGKLPADLLPQ